MFSCDTCGRTYASRTSLARHSQNHRKTKQHSCVHCHVVFYRRDLLARHLRSHERASPSLNAESDRTEVRKRCHTACEECRALKVKCSGNVPCDNCTRLGKSCHLTGASSRISHLAELEEGSVIVASNMPLADQDEEPQAEQGLPPASPEGSEHLSGHMGHDIDAVSNDSAIQQPANIAFPMFDSADLTMAEGDPPDLLEDSLQPFQESNEVNMILDPVMFNSLSWPWHHEFSYLLGPENLDFGSQDPAIQQQHEAEAPQHAQLATNNDDTLEPTTNSASSSRMPGNYRQTLTLSGKSYAETTLEQAQILEEIMTFSLSVKSEPGASNDHSQFWYPISSKVERVFEISRDLEEEPEPILEHYVNLFFKHFEPLWPMFSSQDLAINRLHPLLYLVLVSIGAMYGDNTSTSFGSKLHTRLQATLVEPLELRDPTYDAAWLAQTRCHSRIAALYFGQERAISHAHHLGTLLAAQARRMELFSDTYSMTMMEKFRNMDGSLTDQERLTIWLRLESRRRLAFGIYRSEAYTSLLLQSKPLFYLGEIDLSFPSCDAVWNGAKMDPTVCIQLIENDRTPGRDFYASEIYHIALDGDEVLPPMDPLGYELLALGVLWPTWEYSRNPTLLSRLCGEEMSVPDELNDVAVTDSSMNLSVSPQSIHSLGTSRHREMRDYDHLDRTSRKMRDLHSGYKRLLTALRKWEQSLPMVKSFARSQRDRTLLMSGLIVYHLVHLRLSSPAIDLHELQYGLIDGRSPDASSMRIVTKWLHSPRARFAAERAVSIGSLIAGECAKPAQERAHFNLVALAGLHDAAVLLWAYASTIPDNDMNNANGPPLMLRNRDFQSDYVINRGNTSDILESMANLLDDLSPGKSSSFAQATRGLMNVPFPNARTII